MVEARRPRALRAAQQRTRCEALSWLRPRRGGGEGGGDGSGGGDVGGEGGGEGGGDGSGGEGSGDDGGGARRGLQRWRRCWRWTGHRDPSPGHGTRVTTPAPRRRSCSRRARRHQGSARRVSFRHHHRHPRHRRPRQSSATNRRHQSRTVPLPPAFVLEESPAALAVNRVVAGRDGIRVVAGGVGATSAPLL